jgi:CBS-domain-containing membrane protein
MRKLQLEVDRPGGTRAFTADPDPWQESDHGDFATGTSPGAFRPEPVMRTRVTYLGDDSSIDERSFHQPTEEEDRFASDGHERDDLRRSTRLPSLADRTPLWRVMKPRVVCVRPELAIDSLIAMLIALDLRSVPVVDDAGRPIGVVSRSDLLRHWREGETGVPPLRAAGPYAGQGEYLGGGFHADQESESVADVMMCMSFSLPETATLSRAAAIMAYEGVHRIPVVAADGRVVGLISSLDVVRWLARHDGYVVPGIS